MDIRERHIFPRIRNHFAFPFVYPKSTLKARSRRMGRPISQTFGKEWPKREKIGRGQ